MSRTNLPRQLLAFIVVSLAVSVLICTVFYTLLQRASEESRTAATATVTKLERSAKLFAQIGGMQGDLQLMLRLKDPDEIEKQLKKVEAAQTNCAAAITAWLSAARD